jgi:2-polyprenyl-6-methoxyphenol hydroxylase-like FAD-dependent oxidoreductase
MAAIRHALIIGGGIAGLTMAHALRRVEIAARVIEAGKKSDRLGTGISLLGNALRALDSVGLADACIEAGYGFDVVVTRDSAGNILAEEWPPRTFRPDRAGAFGIMRPVLGNILEKAATDAGATIDYSTTAVRIEPDDHGVAVGLSTGEIVRTDLLVAADGTYSKTRRLIFGEEFKALYCGQGVWRYTTPRPENLYGMTFYRAVNGAVIGAIPLSRTHCYYFILETETEPVHKPEDQLPAMMKARMAPFTAAELVAAAELIDERSPISYRPFDIILMPQPWYKGRVVLVGDAAHSLTPQLTSGGGMAIEDVVVLAEELVKADDVREALQAYSARRAPRVKPIYETSLAICLNEQNPSGGNRPSSMDLLMKGYQMLAAPF